MKITIIVAMSDNKVIGINNEIPWKLSADMQFFKAQTTHQTIVMGRKTFDSLKRPLPHRDNWILTTQKHFSVENTRKFYTVETIINTAKEENIENLFVIGGSQIYDLFLPFTDCLLVTKVKTTIKGDTFFPDFDAHLFHQTILQEYKKDEKNEFDFEIVCFDRITKK
ncbi:MAG: dihydrofolate reductase [Cytophagia bacterium]|nr:MAG: dihydrofolate reductase [Cytophagales bacterium]TAG06690.1 MAG: dihydrofolate reductase [Cytophagia bacterium]